MTITLQTSNRQLLTKLAQIIDVAEGYDASVRRPGYVTERYADIDTKPDNTAYSFVFDDKVWQHRDAIATELAKYGVSKATIAAKAQAIRDGSKSTDSVTFTSGLFNGTTLTWADKGSDWTPAAEAVAAGKE